jgi:uncharacterized protein
MTIRDVFPAWRFVATIVFVGAMITAHESSAQNAGGFSGFLQNLFGGGSAKPTLPVQAEHPLRSRGHSPRKRPNDYISTRATRAPGTPGGAPVVVPNTFISVMGDSLGLLAGEGLSAALASRPDISVVNLARDLSGLTRDDYFDWPKVAQAVASGNPKTDIAVAFLGINDIQPLKANGQTLDPLSEGWRVAYAARVESFVAPLRAANIPVLWVGLPPMRDERLNIQARALNEIYREHSERMGAKYLDISDAFADGQGQFTLFGADAEGQSAKLRTGVNGMYFTKIGGRKIGELLATEIRHLIDKPTSSNEIAALPSDIEEEADSINAQIRREMGVEGRTDSPIPSDLPRAGRILSLSGHPASAHGELMLPIRAREEREFIATSVARTRQFGQLPAPQGRADDFRWPRSN